MIQEARSRLVVTTLAGIAGFAVVACGNTGDLHLQGTTAKPGVTTNQYHAQGITKQILKIRQISSLSIKRIRTPDLGSPLTTHRHGQPAPNRRITMGCRGL
jgi:hypothetical protein